MTVGPASAPKPKRRLGTLLFWAFFSCIAILGLCAVAIALWAMAEHERHCGHNSTVTYHSADCADTASVVVVMIYGAGIIAVTLVILWLLRRLSFSGG